jgi:hypothetical protein
VNAVKISLQKDRAEWGPYDAPGWLAHARGPAAAFMLTLPIGERPTGRTQAIDEFGRIDKALHTLTSIDDEAKRRGELNQLNVVRAAQRRPRCPFSAAVDLGNITVRGTKTSSAHSAWCST